MSSSRSTATQLLAALALSSTVQAQEPPTTPIQTLTEGVAARVVSPLDCPDGAIVTAKNGFQGCVDRTLPTTGRTALGRMGDDMLPKSSPSYTHDHTGITLTPSHSEQYGTGAKVGGVLDRGSWAVGVQVGYTEDMRSVFLAGGLKLGRDATGRVTIGWAQQDAATALNHPLYSGDIEAQSASIGVYIKNAFIQYLIERGVDRTLLTEKNQTITMSDEDFLTFLRRTIVVTDTGIITFWDALQRQMFTVGVTRNIGEKWQIQGSAGATKDPSGTRAVATIKAIYYAHDWRGQAGVTLGSQNERYAFAGVDFLVGKSTTLGARVEHTPANGSMKGDTRVMVQLNHQFGGAPVAAQFIRPEEGMTPTPGMVVKGALDDSRLTPDPSRLGKQRTVVTQNVSTANVDLPYEPLDIDASKITSTISVDGRVTIVFPARAEWSYEYQVDGTAWLPTGKKGYGQFTTAPLTAGKHTVSLRERSPLTGKTSNPTTIEVSLSQDTEPLLGEINVIATENTAEARFAISDPEGIREMSCEVHSAAGGRVGAPVKPEGNICRITGLAPDLDYFFVQTALVAKKNLDGSLTWVIVNKYTPFRTLPEPVQNTPLTLGSIDCTATTVILGESVVCSVTPTDPEGVSSVSARIDGTPVSVSHSGATYSIAFLGLTPGSHTIVWSAIGKNPDGTLEATAQTGSQIIVVNAPADTTPPSQTSPLNLGSFTLGNSLTQTITFDENIATATISGLPSGVTGSTSISGSSVTVTLDVDPLVYTFTSATDTIPFTLTVTDTAPAHNSGANSETASVSDVAPNFPAQADATVNDDGGFNPIIPIPNICPTGADQFGRTIVSCTVTVENPPHNEAGLSYNSGTNSIEGTIDVGSNSQANVTRTINVQGSTLKDIDSSKIDVINNG